MSSPIIAILWENWRLTRSEVIQRLLLSLIVAAVVLVVISPDTPGAGIDPNAATTAFFIGVFIHICCWFSIAKLNGGKFMDGYHPGFPFYLLYPRALRTSVIVAATMAYSAVAAAALYIVWALLMRMAFDVPFPLVPVAAWIAILLLVQSAGYWATRSKFVQWFGTLVGFGACLILALRRVEGDGDRDNGEFTGLWPERWATVFDYGVVDYALMIAIGLACYFLTVAGVARQRRGDAGAARPRTADAPPAPDWLARLFPFPCPTTSATRAQIWFELRSSGLAILLTGLVAAVLIPLLYAASGPLPFMRTFAISIPFLAAVVVLFLGANAFGIRRRQGRSFASVFDASLACRTGTLALRKVLVRTACVLTALGMIAASLWLSLPIIGDWPDQRQPAADLMQARAAIGAAFGDLTGLELVAFAVVATSAICILVTLRAALEALFARYRRRVLITGGAILGYGAMLVFVDALSEDGGGVDFALHIAFEATLWIAPLGIVLAGAYLFWRTITEQLVTTPQVVGAVLVAALFAAAGAILQLPGDAAAVTLSLAGMARLLWPIVPVLLAFALAPWSLSRIRHM